MCLECTSWVIRQWANSHQVDIRQLTNSHDQVDKRQLTNRYQVSRSSSSHPWIIWKKLVISHLFGALYWTKRLFTRVLMCLLCFNDNPSLDLSFTFAWQSLVTISSSAHFSSSNVLTVLFFTLRQKCTKLHQCLRFTSLLSAFLYLLKAKHMCLTLTLIGMSYESKKNAHL